MTAKKSRPVHKSLPIAQLLLDKDNPRLASVDIESASADELVRVLWREMAVDEVALSIAHNGYYEEEPLLVIAERRTNGSETGNYVVVEGNRRLAAVLLLRDATLRRKLNVTELPSQSKVQIARLDELPVVIHPDKESLWAYLGFRHVNGTKPWDAFSKAKYVQHVHENFGVSLDELARRIGDRHATVRRLYRGYIVLRQAERKAHFDVADRIKNRFHFSHLYTALDYQEVQKFLGITEERWVRKEPVPSSKLSNLTDVMTWLYGKQSDRLQPIIRSQFPDLGRLRRVLGNAAAVSLLRSGYSLDEAFEESRGDKAKFRESLSAAKRELQGAKAAVTTGYGGEDDLYDTAEGVIATGQSIYAEMTSKRVNLVKRKAS